MISPIKEVVHYQAGEYLKEILPAKSVVDTFLFYSGEIEFGLAQSDYLLRCHTNSYVVYEFWYCVQENPSRLVEIAEHFKERMDPSTMLLLQGRWAGLKDHYVRAAMFFMLNACSDDGHVSSGKMSLARYNPLLAGRLKYCSFENMRINFYKDKDFLAGLDYLEDPQYILIPLGKFSYNLLEEGKSYGYETTQVNHTATKLKIDEIKHKVVILYKYHKEVLKLYSGYNIIMINKYGKKTLDHQQCEDLVIANF